MYGAAAVTMASAALFIAQTRAEVPTSRTRDGPTPVTMTAILVATRALPSGTVIKPGDTEWRAWPATGLNPAYFVRAPRARANFVGGIIRTAVEAGEPLTAGRLATGGSRGALAAITAPGERAVSIALTATSGVSGLIVPGDRVDVVLTYALPRPTDVGGGALEHRAAETILSNLRVLAVDQRLTAGPADAKDIHNASVEVTVKQSEILAVAADLGKLSLSLRGLESPATQFSATVDSGTLDYQVGRFLPHGRQPLPVGAKVVTRGLVLSAGPTEFHGSKANAVAAPQ